MITVLPTPCWYVQYPDGADTPLDGDPQPHYNSEPEARVSADEMTADEERPAGFYRVAQYEAPCVHLTCDGCGELGTDDDRGWNIHFPDPDTAEPAHTDNLEVFGGRVLCERCKETAERDELAKVGG